MTVHLHNSALHQRAMNPIPAYWLWLNTGNGYPLYEGLQSWPSCQHLHLQLPASPSLVIKKPHTSGQRNMALLQEGSSTKSVWKWHTSAWFKLTEAFLIGGVTWKTHRSQTSLAKALVVPWTSPSPYFLLVVLWSYHVKTVSSLIHIRLWCINTLWNYHCFVSIHSHWTKSSVDK